MAGDREHEGPEEPNRVLGLPRGPRLQARRGEEQQYVAGIPVDWFEHVDLDWLRSLAHPVRGYRRWAQRRRLGIYAPDEDDEPQSKR